VSVEDFTAERPCDGLVVYQPRKGFRYGAEAFWLAGFALEGGPVQSVVDLGTGSGIVALLLAARGASATGYDVRPEWGACWKRTLVDSDVAGDIAFRHQDILDVEHSTQVVVSNPPYFRLAEGPASPDPWKRTARTETTATLNDFVRVASKLCEPGGRLCMVLDQSRQVDFESAADQAGMHLSRVCRVGRRRVLVEAVHTAVRVRETKISESDPRAKRWYALATGDEATL